MSETSEHPILRELRVFFERLLTYRIVGWLTTPLRSAPWWLRCLVFATLLAVIYGPLTWIFAPELLTGVLAACLLIFVTLVAARIVAGQTLDTLESEVLIDLPPSPDQNDIVARMIGRAASGRQMALSLGPTLLLVVLLLPISMRIFPGPLLIMWILASTVLLGLFFNLLFIMDL